MNLFLAYALPTALAGLTWLASRRIVRAQAKGAWLRDQERNRLVTYGAAYLLRTTPQHPDVAPRDTADLLRRLVAKDLAASESEAASLVVDAFALLIPNNAPAEAILPLILDLAQRSARFGRVELARCAGIAQEPGWLAATTIAESVWSMNRVVEATGVLDQAEIRDESQPLRRRVRQL